jgi:antitoxin VapB
VALTIDDPEADRLARELAARTGEPISVAVIEALRERLGRTTRRGENELVAEIMEISRRASALPRRTAETPEEIIGYDDAGLPR